ncbi:response regulator [Variovorax robiniae]|uniref:Response regulator n=1 Tax=Variovorax robiniae TaxID=1836199 RepID=A0ABU8XIP0_9BURK
MATAPSLIAVVDDESAVRTMLGRVLPLAGYSVAPFATGEDFLASLPAALPACAIVDIHMPGLDGFAVLARLRNAGYAIPIIFITASDDDSLDKAAREAGANKLLRKPFSSEALMAAIAAALTVAET